VGRKLIPLALGLAFVLAGCDSVSDMADSVLGKGAKEPLQGKRVEILPADRPIQADPDLKNTEVRLPKPAPNAEWPQAGGFPNHAMQHLALSGNLRQMWRADIGEGDSRYSRITSQPVVAAGRVYGLDGEDIVFARDARSGREVWTFDTKPRRERDTAFGGGVAFADNRLFVTTGYGHLLALDARTGKKIWEHMSESPFRGAPTVIDGRVFAVNVDNELIALAAADGHQLWSHNGLPETADILGSPAPAVAGDTIVVAYSSGEIFALRLENGRPEWTDNLATAQPVGALSSLADIRGRPVIDRGRVFAVSHSGRMVAIDLRTGDRVWEQDIGGTEGPWVAGDYIYVLSNDVSLLCLTWKDGRVRWATNLPSYENPEKKRDPIRWVGPILAGDRLIVVASNGQAFSVSPYTGQAIGTTDFPDGVTVAPVVANNVLYVMTDEAELIALR
jgi:outer membrane protein assembly factor BamB